MEKTLVAAMFDGIAKQYDFLNHFLSLGIDKLWRRKLVKLLKKQSPKSVLDVATGTGDLAIAIQKRVNPEKIIGIDISEQMLQYGRKKIERKKLQHSIDLQYGDSKNIKFDSNTFDAITVAFGVRNFENLEKGLSEMYRVLKTRGMIYILEFSMPKHFPFKQLYRLYFFRILPFIGRLFSGDAHAYRYLSESVEQFPRDELMLNKLKDAGFYDTKYVILTFGIAAIYTGKRA
ncbi:MAG: bifunctional demethylmenaquinone methyltransferase/2-methoxy-6-polyprenyl-1,4-benzoquinol methylase UbiE [Prevotellaceae bacterium]|jgi:demethylmenaquinone methyltransferase/2-methoxy-6-polyprenyl-1,4-benzoquinol methylase|nr:bifunctional demethylmenaquinone methyltransferase/2-methoxy-6-polyprenyl-1,4-benzoquinol methylase UbiE [Prevotellaceae bacterium]